MIYGRKYEREIISFLLKAEHDNNSLVYFHGLRIYYFNYDFLITIILKLFQPTQNP